MTNDFLILPRRHGMVRPVTDTVTQSDSPQVAAAYRLCHHSILVSTPRHLFFLDVHC